MFFTDLLIHSFIQFCIAVENLAKDHESSFGLLHMRYFVTSKKHCQIGRK